MQAISAEIERLRHSFALGNALKEGVPVAIVGAPNVGKSTLLNQLLQEDRAMVSEIAGTTRDVIEEYLTIDGIRFRILDTAGLHHTEDRLEQMGIERTHQSIRRAMIILHLWDAREAVLGSLPTPDFPIREDQTLLSVCNKTDLVADFTAPDHVIPIVARTGEGIDRLRQALRAAVHDDEEQTIVSNARHYEALTTASEALTRALSGLDSNLPTDLLSEEIRSVITAIGSITARGEILPTEILGHIFGHFCIGK